MGNDDGPGPNRQHRSPHITDENAEFDWFAGSGKETTGQNADAMVQSLEMILLLTLR
jgi:hypothetical protein